MITEADVICAVRELTAELGYAPTVREVGQRVGLASSGSIHARLGRLARDGLVTFNPQSARTLRVTPQGEAWLKQNQ